LFPIDCKDEQNMFVAGIWFYWNRWHRFESIYYFFHDIWWFLLKQSINYHSSRYSCLSELFDHDSQMLI